MTRMQPDLIAPLRAENVSFAIGGVDIVEDVNLSLAPGQTTALLGNSGAGKSSLLRIFAGLEQPSQGTIWLGETCLSSSNEMVKAEDRRIGLIFQDFALFPHLTLIGNLLFGLSKFPKDVARKKAMDWLDRINLPHRAEDYPHQLSGGEQQRVAIARALVPDPVAILLDEPFSGLDPALREEVRSSAMDIIKAAGIPALLVTHDAAEAMSVADQLCIMRAGRIVQTGTPDMVYTQPVDKGAAIALGPMIELPAKWNDEQNALNTPFGRILRTYSPGVSSVFVRPEAFFPDISSDVTVDVVDVNRRGHALIVVIERQTHRISIPVPSYVSVSAGQALPLSINPDLCAVF